MYIRQTTDKDPYVIVVTKEELKEAFRSPISYELFRQAIMSELIMVNTIVNSKGGTDYEK